MKKICTKCKIDKSLDLFAIDKKGIHGKHSRCKQCEKDYRLAQGEGVHAAKQKIWRENNREHYRLYARIWEYNRLGLNITKEEYILLHEIQNNKCALCNKIPTSKLCLDHDHITGRIRGLLCRECNLGLGHFKDNIEVLAKAINYLKV